MIHHISIAANEPLKVAQVLAELCQGETAPFPYHPGCYAVAAFDPEGTTIEVLPRGTELTPRLEDEGGGVMFSQNSHPSVFSAFHAAISVPLSETEVHEIAACAGWHVETCDRKGFFNVVEVWIENQQLLEFLPPTFTAQYLAFMQPRSLKAFLSTVVND